MITKSSQHSPRGLLYCILKENIRHTSALILMANKIKVTRFIVKTKPNLSSWMAGALQIVPDFCESSKKLEANCNHGRDHNSDDSFKRIHALSRKYFDSIQPVSLCVHVHRQHCLFGWDICYYRASTDWMVRSHYESHKAFGSLMENAVSEVYRCHSDVRSMDAVQSQSVLHGTGGFHKQVNGSVMRDWQKKESRWKW